MLRNCLHNLHRVIILYYPMSCQLVISDKIFELIEYLLVLSTLLILSIEFYILALTTLLTEFLDILGWWCCLNERIRWFKVMDFPKFSLRNSKTLEFRCDHVINLGCKISILGQLESTRIYPGWVKCPWDDKYWLFQRKETDINDYF